MPALLWSALCITLVHLRIDLNQSMTKAEYLRRQVDQLLELARKTKFPDVRAELEELAKTCLAELDRIERKERQQPGNGVARGSGSEGEDG
jgi:hypothetical protein